MAAIPAFFILLICIISIQGYALKDKDDNEKKLVWPDEYHFKGESLTFETKVKLSFEMWYDGKQSRSRMDINGGVVKKFNFGESENAYSVHPTTTEEKTNGIICAKVFGGPTQIDFLPDVDDFEYTGHSMKLFEKKVDVWMISDTDEYDAKKIKEVTLYVYKTDKGYNLPVQSVMRNYFPQVGKVDSHVVTNYYDFKPQVDEKVFTLPMDEEECHYVGILGEDLKKDLAFLHPDVPGHVDTAFRSYQRHHKREYHEKEVELRKMIFEKNWRMVQEHNSKNLGYKLEVNGFSDKTPEEMRYLHGLLPSRNLGNAQKFPYTLEEIKALAEDLPTDFDLRMEGVVSAVKNQGLCGSCWAFATTSVMETAIARSNGGRLFDFSEQSLIDCSWGFSNTGCEGGMISDTMDYVLKHGIPTEEDYGTYTENDGYCKLSNVSTLYKIQRYEQVAPLNPVAMRVALFHHGAVLVGIHASDVFSLYSSGVLYDMECAHKHPNHAVAVVGYGNRDGEDYWLIKNSYGETWGEDGYILLSARDDNCLVLDTAYYPIV